MTNQVKKLTISGILLSVGFILHQIMPAGIGSVTFDFLLGVLFIIIIINRDFKSALVSGIAAGIIAALTSKFPGGQIPNILDKTITAIIIYLLIGLLNRLPNGVMLGIVGLVGTLISGTIFLGSASVLAGLPASFYALFIGVVIPTAVGNTFFTIFLHRVVVHALDKVNPSLLKQLQG